MEKETQSIKPKRFIQYVLYLILSYEEGECGNLQGVTGKSSMAASLPRCSVQVDIFTSLELHNY